MLAVTLNEKNTETRKETFKLAGCKGVIEPSRPYKFRMWVFIEDLGVRTADVFTDDKEEGKNLLLAKIDELRRTVPARLAAFERIEAALKAKFENLRHGYEFLNAQQNRWRECDAERLNELAAIVEALEVETSGWMDIPHQAASLPAKTLESLNGTNCPKCGRETFKGKTCLKCELTKSANTDIVRAEAATKCKSKTLPSSREIIESPYLPKPSNHRAGRLAGVRY